MADNQFLKRLHLAIATVCYTGYIPYAPGTFGSLTAFLFVLLLEPSDPLLLSILITFSFVGAISAGNVEKELGKDSPHIVIDEFCGYLFSLPFLPKDLPYLISAFIVFRFFDILKPPPIRSIETSLRGGLAIMLDDLVAGIYTNICLQLWRALF